MPIECQPDVPLLNRRMAHDKNFNLFIFATQRCCIIFLVDIVINYTCLKYHIY